MENIKLGKIIRNIQNINKIVQKQIFGGVNHHQNGVAELLKGVE